MIQQTIPRQVFEAYGLGDATARPIGDGMINRTYLAETDGRNLILQDMSPVFEPPVADDFAAATNHLAIRGWEVPIIVEATNGQNYHPGEEGRFWRASTFIESDGQVPELSEDVMRGMGALLARFHVDIATLDYTPRFKILHFHDTPYLMDKLRELLPSMPDEDSQLLAKKVLDQYDALPALPEESQQLIHGDPRASNALYRNQKPITLIDFDTVMKGSVWMDLGDFLRSLGEEERQRGRVIGRQALKQTCEAYREVARPAVDEHEFFDQAVDAARLISLELAARFLADIVDDNYFAWENSGYPNRKSFVTARALLQWEIFKDLTNIKEER